MDCGLAQLRLRANKRVQGERSERAHAVFGLLGPLAVLSNAAATGSGRALFERSEFAPDPARRE